MGREWLAEDGKRMSRAPILDFGETVGRLVYINWVYGLSSPQVMIAQVRCGGYNFA
jgi:hypothetical protein